MAAAGIALAVAGVYAERAWRQARARRALPVAIGVTVQQQSAQFSFSKVEQNRTLFTVRASRATQYKDQSRALLEDVWITLYGRDGSRNDNIHTRECSYEPETGVVRCQGEVTIDIEGARPAPGKSAGPSLQVKTSNLSFNRDTGEAVTPAPVEFHFPQGQGRGVGVTYNTGDATVRVEHDVAFDLAPSEKTGGLPINATGSSLQIQQSEHRVVLEGPAIVREGGRELFADRIAVEFDADNHARRAVAEGHPRIRAAEGSAKIAVAADRFEGLLNPAGWIERIIAGGNVTAQRQTASGADHFTAARAEFTMAPGRNLVREMTATGGVTLESQKGTDSRTLKTEAVRVAFSADERASGKPAGRTMDRQRIESAETLAPAAIESRTARDTTTLRAQRFVAHLDAGGRLDQLLGHANVEVRRQIGNAAPQVISSVEMAATFGARGQWETLDESGDVHFQQASRQVTAARAAIVRATDTITLDGSPVISDSMSRTTAGHAAINQKSGELHATGGVVSTYLAATPGDALSFGAGAAHLSGDALSGSFTSGHVTYAGHARLWQGESVLDADQIELWRDDKKVQAAGHVVAVFPQAASPFPLVRGKSPGAAGVPPAGPTLWKVVAPVLTYWGGQGKAHLEGGVTASSAQGSLESRTLDVFLDPAAPPEAAAVNSAAARAQAPGGRQLSRVLAQGNAVVRQGGRRGSAEQAEYTSAGGKFVLSGGQPTLTDESSNTTTGHSLTFFVASDTILIDSREGSRTLTKHRIEK
jgi:LPS export ABC transporter protein LptC